jgi:hypothetical protein
MNELRLLAKFEAVPPEELNQGIEAEMRSFVTSIVPGAELSATSGYGSWWIVVSGFAVVAGSWLALQFANWAAKKSFDYLAERFKKSSDNDPSAHPGSLVIAKPSEEELASSEQVFNKLAILGSKMSNLAERIGANQINFGEWSQIAARGRIVSLRRTGNEVTLSVYQTDSREDFDSRTTGV